MSIGDIKSDLFCFMIIVACQPHHFFICILSAVNQPERGWKCL